MSALRGIVAGTLVAALAALAMADRSTADFDSFAVGLVCAVVSDGGLVFFELALLGVGLLGLAGPTPRQS